MHHDSYPNANPSLRHQNMPSDRSLFFSDQFGISCGTVTIDVPRSKLLLIYYRKTGEYLLPKGHKDIGESLEETALRETFEETGIKAQLLPVRINSVATTPQGRDRPSLITEPIAVSQRMARDGVLKIMFWYVAIADSTIAPEQGTQQEGEDFDPVWVSFDDVESTVSWEDDRRIVSKAIAAVQEG
ncbi:NUDIX hydrolase domain-like protein [Fusarium venenatum]|uniref:NUDIX hydrolase domain-like protein n=1 Tax=Fusarium venenatum TaxID=56646 RepID=UPI001E14FE81|nr:NUDIX hydrolase domain-like protein [Fusarium venenatum]